MALRKIQKEMAITLFAKAFSVAKDEDERKELYIQFADAYEGSIKDWKNKVEAEIDDEDVKEKFIEFSRCEKKSDIKEYVTVEPLKKEDLEQISYLTSKELDMMPWIEYGEEMDSFVDFVNGGYSYVAKREDVVLGFVLAHKCPAYGGHYYLYVDTFVVSSDAQGNGIGKLLLQKLKENMFKKRIFSMKLMTKRDIKAYKIYRHLGFDEMENYVHMQKF